MEKNLPGVLTPFNGKREFFRLHMLYVAGYLDDDKLIVSAQEFIRGNG
jgi:hypothetical protein